MTKHVFSSETTQSLYNDTVKRIEEFFTFADDVARKYRNKRTYLRRKFGVGKDLQENAELIAENKQLLDSLLDYLAILITINRSFKQAYEDTTAFNNHLDTLVDQLKKIADYTEKSLN